ncbi:MAG: hypothetical protein D3M94_18530 [Rhodocyclales bacterium GT-UBC]|nr:MAG: hypothetical protein D3M94_18530 [Rhodocyclales bacterium GT-UBC]
MACQRQTVAGLHEGAAVARQAVGKAAAFVEPLRESARPIVGDQRDAIRLLARRFAHVVDKRRGRLDGLHKPFIIGWAVLRCSEADQEIVYCLAEKERRWIVVFR